MRFGDTEVPAGEWVTIDGSTGFIYAGQREIARPPGGPYLDRLLEWADDTRRLGVWANADTALSAAAARVAGADGIGLARTEYMFQGERLGVVRRILLSDRGRDRTDALEELESLQIGDFEELLEAMDGIPVVVRLLDPPVHEFLPSRVDIELEMAQRRVRGAPTEDLEALEAAGARWSEVNPMLGLRGVRLAVVIPEIYRVQVLAALEAVRRRLDAGGDPRLQLMIPLVGSIEELRLVRDMIDEEVHSAGRLLEIAIGTMIELPRAALMAGELALASDFFSFGTNDLTQTTMGLEPRRCRSSVPRRLSGSRSAGRQPLPADRPGRSREPDTAGDRGRAGGKPRSRNRCLWRAWRRPCFDRLLPPGGVSTMCRAARRVCLSPGWPPPRLPFRQA